MTTNSPRRYPVVKRVALMALVFLTLLLLLQVAVFARWKGSGAGGCGAFLDSVAQAEAGDVLAPMIPARSSGGAVITKSVTIQGGWLANPSCDEPNQTFPDPADALAAGFTHDPDTPSTLFHDAGPVLEIDHEGSLTIENMALRSDGPVASGGGIHGVIDNGAHVILDSVVISGAVASGAGGGLYLEVRGGSTLEIRDSQFFGNQAAQGGGFEIQVYDDSTVIMENSQVHDNSAPGGGAGGRIVVESGTISLTHNSFYGNSPANALDIVATGYGSASIWLDGNLFEGQLEPGPGELTVRGRNPELGGNNFNPCTVYNVAGGDAIDFLDIQAVAGRWQAPGAYDARYDVAPPARPDGVIGIEDVQATAGRFGDSCYRSLITEVELQGGDYAVYFATFGYTPQAPPPSWGHHVHFFFNTVPPEQAGVPGSGPWFAYGGGSPFTGYSQYDRPAGATRMCILVANPDHSIRLDTGNCFDLP